MLLEKGINWGMSQLLAMEDRSFSRDDALSIDYASLPICTRGRLTFVASSKRHCDNYFRLPPRPDDFHLQASCIFYYRSFHYIPSKMAAFATAGLFFIITAVSLWLTCKHRKSRYMWTVPLMGFCEAAGEAL